MANLVLAVILAVTQWRVVDQPTILLWSLLLLIVTLVRVSDYFAYRRYLHAAQEREDERWLWHFRLGVMWSGLTWAAAAHLLLPPDNIAHQSLMAFVMAGLSAGAMTSMAVDRRSVLLFVVPLLLSLVVALVRVHQGDEPQLTMAFMLLIFLVYVFGSSSRVQRTMCENMQLQQVRQQKEAAESQILIERELFAGGPVAVFVWSPREGWPVEYVSRNVVDVLGYTPQELMAEGFSYASLIHPEDVGTVEHQSERHLEMGAAQFEQSYRLRTSSGEYRWFYDFTMPERDESGRLLRIRGYIFDQSEIRQAQETMRETSAMLAGVLEAASEVAIIATNREGEITLFNRGAELMLGYRAEEMLEQSLLQLCLPQEVEQRAQALHEQFADKVEGFRTFSLLPEREGAEEREWTLQRKDGSQLFASVVVTSIYSANGQSSGYLAIAKDVTAARKVQRMKDEFISTVSHELRTPLTSICGSLSLLEGGAMGELSPQVMQLVTLAHQNSKRLAALINDLLDMEKIEVGELTLDLQRQSLQPMLERVVEEKRSEVQRYGINLLTEMESSAQVMVEVDAVRLQQVLDNYLSNAIKFSPANGTIWVRATEQAGRIRVTVTDSGNGIKPQHQSLIFQKFTQVDSSDTRQQGGTGLGLAISKALIERMGGEVGFSSPPGEGASFWFELPVITAKEVA